MEHELDYEPENDMDEDDAPPAAAAAAPAPRIASKIQRGRGLEARDDRGARGGVYDRLASDKASGGVRSIEGWVIFVTNIQEEASEEDVIDAFAECGDVKGIQMNLDRRTGYVKGYAAIEYASEREAAKAIEQMDGQEILGQAVSVDWAFVAPAESKRGGGGGGGGGGARAGVPRRGGRRR